MTGWLTLLATLAVHAAEPPPGGWPVPPKTTTVASVYDGDTVTLASRDKVRLRWVNTPELRPREAFGDEARQAADAFLKGKTVTLVLAGENPRDGYGRLLAGLRTGEGDLSEHLLEKGLAHLFIIPPEDTDLAPLIAAQTRAQKAKRGIWSTERYRGALHITSFHSNAPGDDRENVNGEYLRVCNVTPDAVNVGGYVISDRGGRRFTLPSLTIPPGNTVKIHSGKGEHQTDASKQLAIYLGSDGPIWNNDSDRATIEDRFGKVVDFREY